MSCVCVEWLPWIGRWKWRSFIFWTPQEESSLVSRSSRNRQNLRDSTMKYDAGCAACLYAMSALSLPISYNIGYFFLGQFNLSVFGNRWRYCLCEVPTYFLVCIVVMEVITFIPSGLLPAWILIPSLFNSRLRSVTMKRALLSRKLKSRTQSCSFRSECLNKYLWIILQMKTTSIWFFDFSLIQAAMVEKSPNHKFRPLVGWGLNSQENQA